MYLARREFGKALRVYPVKTNDSPCAWLFDAAKQFVDGMPHHILLVSGPGAAATGKTRSEALSNLHVAEEAAQHA